jgi:hypothetical protein
MISGFLNGNTQTYKVDTLRSEYKELETYNSIALEMEGDFFWEKRFELPFVFPYYDSLYTHLICDYGSTCYFDFNPEYDIKLMTFSYEFDNVLDPTNIESDVRYNFVNSNGKQALIIQYTKNRLASDKSIADFDSYINFQLWFYEDGVMEVHFGDINLDNSPNYRPGEGFYFLFNDGTEMNSGPEMGVRHPLNEEDQTWLDGDWNNYFVDNAVGYLTTLPPKGFIIRFSKKTSSVAVHPNKHFKVYPNPSSNILSIDFDENIVKARILGIGGDVIQIKDLSEKKIDIQMLNCGIYILELQTAEGIFQAKFIKN